MPKHFRRKKRHSNAPHRYRINKTKNYSYLNPEDVKSKVGDEDVAGSGLFHCDVCCRHFQSEDILTEHLKKSTQHKKQKRRQKIEAEAEAKDQMRAPKRIRRVSGAGDDVEMSTQIPVESSSVPLLI